MTVVFTVPHRLDETGPGRPLGHAVKAVQDRFDDPLIVTPDDLEEMVEVDRLGDTRGAAFDELVAWWFEDLGIDDLDVFLGGGGACLQQIGYVREHHPDAVVGTTWFSSHFEYTMRVLGDEYEALGVEKAPIHPYTMTRSQREQARSDYVIVPSEACRNTYPESVRDKAHVAEFGVDSDVFHPPDEPRGVDKVRFLFPATNPARKGVRHVFRALRKLQPRWGEFEVVVTGGFEYPQIDNLPCVTNKGWVADEQMPDLYRACDALLLPSVEEGQALASLEAAASGLALVVTEHVGLPITHGQEGVYVESKSAEDIAEKIEILLDSPEAARTMGSAARIFAEPRSWERFGDRWADILEEVAP